MRTLAGTASGGLGCSVRPPGGDCGARAPPRFSGSGAPPRSLARPPAPRGRPPLANARPGRKRRPSAVEDRLPMGRLQGSKPPADQGLAAPAAPPRIIRRLLRVCHAPDARPIRTLRPLLLDPRPTSAALDAPLEHRASQQLSRRPKGLLDVLWGSCLGPRALPAAHEGLYQDRLTRHGRRAHVL
jgi:hypothetical protein